MRPLKRSRSQQLDAPPNYFKAIARFRSVGRGLVRARRSRQARPSYTQGSYWALLLPSCSNRRATTAWSPGIALTTRSPLARRLRLNDYSIGDGGAAGGRLAGTSVTGGVTCNVSRAESLNALGSGTTRRTSVRCAAALGAGAHARPTRELSCLYTRNTLIT